MGLRVAVTGATGNVGTSVLAALAAEPAVDTVVGIARRRPAIAAPKTTWATADVATDALEPLLDGADCVIHLAWLIQPSRDLDKLERVNVEGSRRVFEAAVAVGAGAIVYASSVGAYSPGPKDRRVDERWPTGGVATSYYGRQKAAVERILDEVERAAPAVRVVRLRPALIFKREAATEIRRLFVGPFLPSPLVRRRLIAAVPATERLAFQAVHSIDVGHAFRLAAVGEASGAFNLAAEPVLDPPTLAAALAARELPLPFGLLRGAAGVAWRARAIPASPGWLDLARAVPLMDASRAHRELGWQPSRNAVGALLELLDGIRAQADHPTPPLAGASGGRLRLGELAAGVGAREVGRFRANPAG